jgi:glycerol-3-phosphate dehydrogenase subunit B
MSAGDLRDGTAVAIVGLRRLKDMYAGLIADNLSRTDLPSGGRVTARAAHVDFVVRDGEIDSSGVVTARALDDSDTLLRFADAVARVLTDDDHVVGVPAVLGLADPHTAWSTLQARIGRPVFEIPLPPPSVPGIRMNASLTSHAKAAGVRFMMGGRVVGATRDGVRITGLQTETAGRLRLTASPWIVFAPGGFESGAIDVDSYGTIREPVFDLPLAQVPDDPFVSPDYWADHALFRAGVAVDGAMRPVDANGIEVLDNVVVAGGIIGGASRWREKSGEGIAIATAVRAADTIIKDGS